MLDYSQGQAYLLSPAALSAMSIYLLLTSLYDESHPRYEARGGVRWIYGQRPKMGFKLTKNAFQAAGGSLNGC